MSLTTPPESGDEVTLPDHQRQRGFRAFRVRRNAQAWFRVIREGGTVPFPRPILKGRSVGWEIDWTRREDHADFGYAEDCRQYVEEVGARETKRPETGR